VKDDAAVSLLTMHNAKGLEFPAVFIAGMEEGLFPHSRSRESEAQLEEERRLCYVAMTRAEQRLYLSHARMRRRYGGSPPEACLPSRFLDEVPSHLVLDMNEQLSRPGHVDLYGEREAVREVARRNTYTGKTYNSLDHVTQFFADRGIQLPSMAPKPASASQPAGPASTASQTPGARPQAAGGSQPAAGPSLGAGAGQPLGARPAAPVRPSPAAASARPAGPVKPAALAPKTAGVLKPGATVFHAKYGRGTLLRKEGDGEDAKLIVSFHGHGLKKLVAKFAALRTEG
jgi:DNA helicase-2/ATP-dependent DNA helicase PcrA